MSSRFRSWASRAAPAPSGPTGNPDRDKASSAGTRYFLALGVASIIALGLLLTGLGVFNQGGSTGPSTTTITSYGVSASSTLSSAASYASSDGYLQGSTRQLTPRESGFESGGYLLFSDQAGDAANMTVLVFNSSASAQRYTDSVIRNAKDLSGYTNANSTLTGYQEYGACYGYAQSDPDGGGAVATGVCNKGNVYIQVHFATASSIQSAEGGVSDLVGAAYQGVD